MRDRLGFIVEPACATLAGLLERYKKKCEGKKVGIIACAQIFHSKDIMKY